MPVTRRTLLRGSLLSAPVLSADLFAPLVCRSPGPPSFRTVVLVPVPQSHHEGHQL